MPFKGWVVNRVNRMFTRVDLPPRPSPIGEAMRRVQRDADVRAAADADGLSRARHLGAYAPLVAAIREELEHFASSQVQMHLAIAEHDRYLLTSIAVTCEDNPQARELLQRFVREFKPEQVKQFLAREVIGRLPNASAIDLAHFSGLDMTPPKREAAANEAYGDLLAELHRSEPALGQRSYQVLLSGRWSERTATSGTRSAEAAGVPRTPLVGRSMVVDIEDADGSHRVTVPSVTPGQRYAIGHGGGCDIVVAGKYASRRHCEIWLDQGKSWVTDCGSTNGIRVELANRVLGRSGTKGRDAAVPIEVPAGAHIVLSASARGDAAEYPRVYLRTTDAPAVPVTPLAPSLHAPATPSTPIVVARPASVMTVTVHMASGERTVDVPVDLLPFRVGRSRNQALVIDWTHDDVSGHHLDIAKIDAQGADVVVHGDNGVSVGGTDHPLGATFRWNVGEKLVLGRATGAEPECALVLHRRS